MQEEQQFDAVEFINRNYAEATYYELNESLSTLSESIAKTQQTSKALIAEHFSKFIACRAIMGEIWADIKNRGLDKPLTARIEQQYTILLSKYNEISMSVSKDLHEPSLNEKRAYYSEEYKPLFTLKEDLSQNALSLENFATIYKRARHCASDVMNSVFVQRCFEEVQPLVQEYLEKIYRIITDSKTSFDDACYYFDLYFSVKGRKTERKIMNTLLVNFKATVEDNVRSGSKNVQYLLSALSRLLKNVDGDIASSAIEHFLSSIDKIFESTNILSTKRLFVILKDFAYTIGSKESKSGVEPRRLFVEKLSEVKLKMFRQIVFRERVETVPEIFNKLQEVFDESERNECKSIIASRVIAAYKEKNFADTEYLKHEARDMGAITDLLGPRTSPWNKNLRRFLRGERNRAIVNVAKKLVETIKARPKSAILMECVRIIAGLPNYYERIFFEAKDAIQSDPVLFFYLARAMKMERPSVSDADCTREIERLRPHFRMLLERIYL